MAGTGEYIDFDLLIEPHDDAYRARVLSSPSGEAETSFALPFSLDRIELKALQLLPMRGTRRASPQRRKQARDFGSMLFDSVFVNDVKMCFRDSQREAKLADKGLRIRLRLGDASLEIIPWEFLYSDMQDDFLVLSRHTPIVRYIEMPNSLAPQPIALPLKILVMISNPIDHAQLDTEEEWQRLNSALADRIERGDIELTRVPKGTLPSLRETLQTGAFHIFHYIGHAAFDEAHDDGVLVLEGADGKASIVAGRDLSTILADQSSLRLALLNACEGARTSDEDRFNGIAQSLIRRGLPAAIAMQFEISDDAAKDLAHDFYGALAAGLPVDTALAEARRGVFSKGNVIEWATPVLYLRSGSGSIFEIADAAPLHLSEEAQRMTAQDIATPVAELAPATEDLQAHAIETAAAPVAASQARVAQPPADSTKSWWRHPAAMAAAALLAVLVLVFVIGAIFDAGQATGAALRERLTQANVSVANISDEQLDTFARGECSSASGTGAQWFVMTNNYDARTRAISDISLQTYCPTTWTNVNN